MATVLAGGVAVALVLAVCASTTHATMTLRLLHNQENAKCLVRRCLLHPRVGQPVTHYVN